MAVRTFGVVVTSVRAHYFPQLAAFSSSTTPTSETVEEMVQAEAAKLAGALVAAGQSAATLNDDGGDTYPASYAWCADTIRLGAAVRVAWAMAGGNESSEAWSLELARRYSDLEENGYQTLGDAPAPDDQPQGPRSHRTTHGLTRDTATNMSDVVPRFRKSDVL